MYNRNPTIGSLAIIAGIVLVTASPTLADDLAVDGNLNVKDNAVIRGNTRIIDGSVGIGVRTQPAARLQIFQVGSAGVGLFLGDRAPFGRALFETDLTAPATHAWFAENGDRVFSVTGGGGGFFKGSLDVGGDERIRTDAQIDGVLVIGTHAGTSTQAVVRQ